MNIQLPAHGWKPRWYQLPAWNAMLSPEIDTTALAWHRRAGKDDIAMHSRAIRAMQRVGNYWHLLPQQEQARKAIWESVNPKTGRVRWKDCFPDEIISHVDNQGMKLTFKNGSTWQLLGSDNYNCYSDDTEILTEAGWQFFTDLTGYERVATLDNGKLVYAPIRAVVHYPYKGEMYRVKNSSIDLLTTPNHKYFVESGKGVCKFKQIDDPTILGDKIPATCEWEGEVRETHTLHGINARNNVWRREQLTFDMHDWCAFIGIFLAEGSTFSDRKGNYRVTISQKKAHTCAEIAALLKRMKLYYKYDKNPGNFVVNSKILFDYCAQFGLCHQKYVPHDLKNLARPYLQTLIDWMVKGDGHITAGGTLSYASTSMKLAGDFQELMIKLGFSGNIREQKQPSGFIRGRKVTPRLSLWVFNRRKSKYKYFRDTHETYVATQPYDGEVWCVDAGSHVIKVRRKGFEAWCGNSLVGTTPVDIVYSEAGLADPNAFAFLRPILLENKGSSLYISSTRGRNHFFRQFELAKESKRGFAQLLSAYDTDVFTEEQLQDERRSYIQLYGDAIGTALFEQEYLSSWDAATIGAVFGAELRTLEAEGRALPLRYDPRFPVVTSWDIGVLDPTIILFWQIVGNTVRLIDWYQATDTGIEHFADVLSKKPYFYQAHIGPHDTKNREWGSNGQSRIAIAKKLGVAFERVENTSKSDSIAAGSRLVKMMEINVHDKAPTDPYDDCSFILDALRAYAFRFDKERRIMSKAPMHDWSSHYADAMMTFALWYATRKGTSKPVVQGRNVPDAHYQDARLSDIMNRQQRTGVSRSAFS